MMSVFAALIVVVATLTTGFAIIQACKRWADDLPLGRMPVTIVVAIVTAVIVQLPLPEGPDWRNVPEAFVIVAGYLG